MTESGRRGDSPKWLAILIGLMALAIGLQVPGFAEDIDAGQVKPLAFVALVVQLAFVVAMVVIASRAARRGR